MKVVATRVSSAAVSVAGKEISRLERGGILALIGVAADDEQADVDYIVSKISQLRMLEGDTSAIQEQAEILAVSQFTLMGQTRKGRRPNWSKAAGAEKALHLFNGVCEGLRQQGLHVCQGAFGEMMSVSSVNEGPFTLLIDSNETR